MLRPRACGELGAATPGADLQQFETEDVGESLAQQLALDLDDRATQRCFEPGPRF